ncbi:MAG: hypothetical protein SP1CHLAM54_15600 [Chlamydiia bacterium]|nr:hypothetical protein [Chlamydiia bacterium]MCH9616450.1 hypothetical protein [Chlamydiia bacterium]MCH9629564.1 hypothetical protein [Chlamydiia bacterium]
MTAVSGNEGARTPLIQQSTLANIKAKWAKTDKIAARYIKAFGILFLASAAACVICFVAKSGALPKEITGVISFLALAALGLSAGIKVNNHADLREAEAELNPDSDDTASRTKQRSTPGGEGIVPTCSPGDFCCLQ